MTDYNKMSLKKLRSIRDTKVSQNKSRKTSASKKKKNKKGLFVIRAVIKRKSK